MRFQFGLGEALPVCASTAYASSTACVVVPGVTAGTLATNDGRSVPIGGSVLVRTGDGLWNPATGQAVSQEEFLQQSVAASSPATSSAAPTAESLLSSKIAGIPVPLLAIALVVLLGSRR